MTLGLFIRTQAYRDVTELADYIAKDDVLAAARFGDSFLESAQFLQSFPASGEVWKTRRSKSPPVRQWPVEGFPNHLIFFRATEDEVTILRVFHGARDLRGLDFA